MEMKYNYDNYGNYKSKNLQSSKLKIIARKIGFKNRYLKFLKPANFNDCIVEIGCGNGSFLNELNEAGFTNLIGVEPSISYNKMTTIKILPITANEYFQILNENTVDIILALDVFEHIEYNDLKTLLSLTERIMKSNGRIIFRVPNMSSPLSLPNFFGDLSHTTPLNQLSILQLIHDSKYSVLSFHNEPLSYPQGFLDLFAILIWKLFEFFYGLSLRAFGIKNKVLTPNIICILKKNEN